MDKKKLYIIIAVVAVVLVACLIVAFVPKGGNDDVKNPSTTQGTGSDEIEGTGEQNPDATGGNEGSGNESTGNGSTGNGTTGNGSTGNGTTGNGSTGNGTTGNGSTSEGNNSADVDISIELELVPNDFDNVTPTTGETKPTESTGATDAADKDPGVIRFQELIDAAKNGK